MRARLFDARAHLDGLVGTEIQTVTARRPNSILRLDGADVIVATQKSPDGERVPIQWIQDALDVLAREGEVTVDVETLGYRSAFVGAVLATLPGVSVRRTTPPRIELASPPKTETIGRIAPPALRLEIFDETMRSLEAGLTVRDVATFELESCRGGDSAQEVLNGVTFDLFDAIPVTDGGRVVGVLERQAQAGVGQTAEDAMRRLDDSLLVSAHDPLNSLVRLLADKPYRLVVENARIFGIVTRSDVHKLPMRLLVFASVTHLELLMAEIITRRTAGDRWIEELDENRRAKFEEKRAQLRSANFDPPLIELTDFCDKRDLMLPLLGELDVGQRKAKSELQRIEQLRNKVAHAAGFATDQAEFDRFAVTFENAEAWIRRLSAALI